MEGPKGPISDFWLFWPSSNFVNSFCGLDTSKSRLAVDREFMYIGSAGPGPGGRAEGRADGRTGGRAGGRADGRAAGLNLNDSTTIFIVFHKHH